MEDSASPTGRYAVMVSPWEVRMSLWIETPVLFDCGAGKPLLRFKDPLWSANSADWLGDSVVALKLRKYPGNHVPAEVTALIDCAAGTAQIDGKRVDSLARVERCLDDALEWPPSTPPAGGRGLRTFFRALFGRAGKNG